MLIAEALPMQAPGPANKPAPGPGKVAGARFAALVEDALLKPDVQEAVGEGLPVGGQGTAAAGGGAEGEPAPDQAPDVVALESAIGAEVAALAGPIVDISTSSSAKGITASSDGVVSVLVARATGGAAAICGELPRADASGALDGPTAARPWVEPRAGERSTATTVSATQLEAAPADTAPPEIGRTMPLGGPPASGELAQSTVSAGRGIASPVQTAEGAPVAVAAGVAGRRTSLELRAPDLMPELVQIDASEGVRPFTPPTVESAAPRVVSTGPQPAVSTLEPGDSESSAGGNAGSEQAAAEQSLPAPLDVLRDRPSQNTLSQQPVSDAVMLGQPIAAPAGQPDRALGAADLIPIRLEDLSLADAPERWIERLGAEVTALAESEHKMARLHLRPQTLGEMTILVELRDDRLSTQLIVETPAAQQVLRDHADQLRAFLAENGLKLEQSSVEVGNGQRHQADQQKTNNKASGEQDMVRAQPEPARMTPRHHGRLDVYA